MNTTIYKKGSLEGKIGLINTTVGPKYLAVGAVKSRTFKTFAGAEKFMLNMGYTRK
ncbi:MULTISPECIES: hypothetical protein [unclassified Dysgonomonas]|uniref:hypothetical protein n=1 Tax=unclassified Dysgonomonas TaxID=2630389 RepID=UPI0025BF6259|nr:MULTISPECIES: hypothetical protein [unclassified Dysgonomonas]HMM02035.1 hypothetical protein [Dysgonomonas sp.]